MDKPLLTLSQVGVWKERATELESQIAEAQKELDAITDLLDAASFFLKPAGLPAAATPKDAAPSSNESTEAKPGTEEGKPFRMNIVGATPTLGDRIVKAVGNRPSGAEPRDIREALRTEGYDMTALDANSSYLYTALSRLVKQGRLEKRRGKYRAKNPSQDGTGAVAAPVRH